MNEAERSRRALQERTDAAGELLERLSVEELVELVVQEELGWPVLRAQSDRAAALELFSLRLQVLLTRGAIDRAVAEVAAPELADDLPALPALGPVAAAVLPAAAWRGEARVEELLERLSPGGGDGAAAPLAAQVKAALALAPAWRRSDEEMALPPALRRFVELFPSVGHAFRGPLVDELAAALASARLEILRALDRLHAADPALLRAIDRTTEEIVPAGADRLAYDDLPERERSYIATAMQRVAWRLVPRPPGARRWTRLGLGAGLAGLGGVAVGGYVGLLVAAGVLSAAVINEGLSSLGGYLQVTRDRVADAVVETGLPPDRMLEWAVRRGGGADPDHPFGIDAGFAEDPALHTLGRLARVCILWSRAQPDEG